MNSSTTRTQQIIRHTLTLAMSVCFIAAGWLLLKPLVRPASAEAATTSTSSTAPWTTKAIEEVAVGDLVLARDEHGTALGWKPVKEVYRRTSYHLRHLTFRDAAGHEQMFETTDEHPFWSVTAKKFVNAGELQIDDHVVSAPSHTQSGHTPINVDPAFIQTLTTTHRDEHPDGITVFNFQVEDFHTYFVAAKGATGPPVLVHNADYFPNDPKDLLPDLPRDGKGRIYPNELTRIRPEQHPLLPGDTFSPRHHGQHYHVETRPTPTTGWGNNSVQKLTPPGYVPGEGTGFLPSEAFP